MLFNACVVCVCLPRMHLGMYLCMQLFMHACMHVWMHVSMRACLVRMRGNLVLIFGRYVFMDTTLYVACVCLRCICTQITMGNFLGFYVCMNG